LGDQNNILKPLLEDPRFVSLYKALKKWSCCGQPLPVLTTCTAGSRGVNTWKHAEYKRVQTFETLKKFHPDMKTLHKNGYDAQTWTTWLALTNTRGAAVEAAKVFTFTCIHTCISVHFLLRVFATHFL
jgi:hypothetical protein